MIHWEFDYERCLRSKGKDCRNCIWACPTSIIGIKGNRPTVNPDLLQKDCIFCTSCQNCCMVDSTVIKVWDDENPQLTHIPSILKRLIDADTIMVPAWQMTV